MVFTFFIEDIGKFFSFGCFLKIIFVRFFNIVVWYLFFFYEVVFVLVKVIV